MIVINLFMLIWGIELVQTTWHQVIAEFPILSVGLTYSADPDRRHDHAALHHRAAVDRRHLRARRRRRPRLDEHGIDAAMDAFVLIASFALFCAIGVPVAYSLGLSAIVTAHLDRHPAGSGDAQDLRRRRQFPAARHPVLRRSPAR